MGLTLSANPAIIRVAPATTIWTAWRATQPWEDSSMATFVSARQEPMMMEAMNNANHVTIPVTHAPTVHNVWAAIWLHIVWWMAHCVTALTDTTTMELSNFVPYVIIPVKNAQTTIRVRSAPHSTWEPLTMLRVAPVTMAISIIWLLYVVHVTTAA